MIFRPSSSIRLPVPHIQQQDEGECLAACAAMVCAHQGILFEYDKLVKTLLIRKDAGTPFYNIRNLETLKITVGYRTQGSLRTLFTLLQNGWPCIVGVQTKELAYWENVASQHAVVVIGMDQDRVYLHDPAISQPAISASFGDFDLAWFAQNEVYAVLAP